MSRPITVTVGGLATADADGISLSQKAATAGTNYLVLNGALGTFDADGVCQSQTPSGAGALTLNGALASGGVVYLGAMRRIYITGGSDESGKTFAVVGTGMNASGGTFAVTETITGPDASIAGSVNQYYTITSITVSAATTGAITVGYYDTTTLDKARRVIFTSGDDDTGITFTIVGTDINGSPQTEDVTGADTAAASTVMSYKTVASVSSDGAVATTVTVGTNGVADSQWVLLDSYGAMTPTALQVTASGTINFTVRQTLDNPTSLGNAAIYNRPDLVTWVDHPDSALAAATATAQGNYAYAPALVKIVANSGTGTATLTVIQGYQG